MPKSLQDKRREKREKSAKPFKAKVYNGSKREAAMSHALGDMAAKLRGTEDALKEMAQQKIDLEDVTASDDEVKEPSSPSGGEAPNGAKDKDSAPHKKEEYVGGDDLSDQLPSMPYFVYRVRETAYSVSALVTHGACMAIGNSFAAVCSLASVFLGTDELIGRACGIAASFLMEVEPTEVKQLSERHIDQICASNQCRPASGVGMVRARYLLALWLMRAKSSMRCENLIPTHAIIPIGEHVAGASKTDRRAPFATLARRSDDAVTIAHDKVLTVSGDEIDLLSDVAVAKHVASTSELLTPEDLANVGNVVARQLYSNVPGKWSDSVTSDTARKVILMVNQRQARNHLLADPPDPHGTISGVSIPSWLTWRMMLKHYIVVSTAMFLFGVGHGALQVMAKDSPRRWVFRACAAVSMGLAGASEEGIVRNLSKRGRACFALGEWAMKGFPVAGARAVCMHNAIHGHENAVAMHFAFNFIATWTGVCAGWSPILSLIACLWNLFKKPKMGRLFGYGYRKKEVNLPKRNVFGKDAELTKLSQYHDAVKRVPCQVSLGPSIQGYAPPMPDPGDASTALDGAKHRFACDCVTPDRGEVIRFRRFVRGWIRDNLEPLRPDEMLSFEEWLEGTHYSEGRKRELTRVWDESNRQVNLGKTSSHLTCKCFVKRETYTSYKHARAICSRLDPFKCAVGPAAKSIEKKLYDVGTFFIKHVPVKDRARFVMEKFGHLGGPYIVTDYTSFEKSFHQEIMLACEVELYDYMLVWFPDERRMLRRTAGENKCVFRWFQIELIARRMSGEMTTSLGNGFTNLMLCLYSASRCGARVEVLVEGDDGLIYSDKELDVGPIERLGFQLKKDVHTSLLTTSFCGLNLSRDMISMTDPRKVLLTFFWTHSPMMWGNDNVRKGLLRAKALSLLYEHPRCPILSVLASHYIHLTEGTKARFESNWYELNMQREASANQDWAFAEHAKGITPESRVDFDILYEVSVAQQKALEREILTWGMSEIRSGKVNQLLVDYRDPAHYYAHYVTERALF